MTERQVIFIILVAVLLGGCEAKWTVGDCVRRQVDRMWPVPVSAELYKEIVVQCEKEYGASR